MQQADQNENPELSSQKLDPMQLELLEMFSTKALSKEELRDIKILIANYFAQKADAAMDQLFEEKNWDVQEKVKEWGHGHNRHQSGS